MPNSRFGAPIVMVSDSAHPRIIQICHVTGNDPDKLYTSIGLRFEGAACSESGHLVLRSAVPGFGFMDMHVWPDDKWQPEAGLYFVEQLCDQGFCLGEAAADLLRAHDLWADPFAVCAWKLPRNGADRAVGGLRMTLANAASLPVCELLMKDGATAFALPMPVRSELQRSA